MRIFERRPDVQKLAEKKDIEGLVKALQHKDTRERAMDAILTLATEHQAYVQILLHWGLFHRDENVRKSIAKVFSREDTTAIAVWKYCLEDIERGGWAAAKEKGVCGLPPDDMWTKGALPHKPDEEKLADRVRQFKSWMATPDGMTNVLPSGVTASAEKEITIGCQGCGREYTLGKNAIVVSASATMSGFQGVTLVGNSTIKNTQDTPDLVDSLQQRSWSSLDQAIIRQQQTEIGRISSSLLAAIPQWWRCRNCGNVQIYQAKPPVDHLPRLRTRDEFGLPLNPKEESRKRSEMDSVRNTILGTSAPAPVISPEGDRPGDGQSKERG